MPARVAVVPARAQFTVELTTALNTETSYPGEPFRARVASPLATVDGVPVVEAGAVLRGRIVGVRHAPATLFLKFDDIATRWGSRLIGASLTAVQPLATVRTCAPTAQYDGGLQSTARVPLAETIEDMAPCNEEATPETPTTPDETQVPMRLLLRPGARIQLVLREPLEVAVTTSTPPAFAP